MEIKKIAHFLGLRCQITFRVQEQYSESLIDDVAHGIRLFSLSINLQQCIVLKLDRKRRLDITFSSYWNRLSPVGRNTNKV